MSDDVGARELVALLKGVTSASGEAATALRGVNGQMGSSGGSSLSAAGQFAGNSNAGSNLTRRSFANGGAADFEESERFSGTFSRKIPLRGIRRGFREVTSAIGIYDILEGVNAANEYGRNKQKFENALIEKEPLEQTQLRAKEFANDTRKILSAVEVATREIAPYFPLVRIAAAIGGLIANQIIDKGEAEIQSAEDKRQGVKFFQDIKAGGMGIRVGAHDRYFQDTTGTQAFERFVKNYGEFDKASLEEAVGKVKAANEAGLRAAKLGDVAKASKEFGLANGYADRAHIYIPGQNYGDPAQIFLRNQFAEGAHKQWIANQFGRSTWRTGD